MLISTKVAEEKTPPDDPNELVDPVTGEIINPNDIDQLIETYQRIDEYCRSANGFRQKLSRIMAEHTSGDKKTRRLRGRTRIAKVTLPPDSWSQSVLKEAWNSYPKFRDEFLRISSLAVKLREWKKLENTTGEKDLEQFKSMIASANQGETGTPRIDVEK